MRQIWIVIEHYLPIVTYSYIVLLTWLWRICLLDYIEVSSVRYWLFVRTILQIQRLRKLNRITLLFRLRFDLFLWLFNLLLLFFVVLVKNVNQPWKVS